MDRRHARTGTRSGRRRRQKLGFFSATPVVQPTSTTDLRTALINLGLYATGGASPLSLNGGALTVGSATIADGGNVASARRPGQDRDGDLAEAGLLQRDAGVQQTDGAATAGGTYTSTEQAMLQAVYNRRAGTRALELIHAGRLV